MRKNYSIFAELTIKGNYRRQNSYSCAFALALFILFSSGLNQHFNH